ncbi:MAG: aldo/keto reductase [Pseudomonadota bacterium]
MQLAYGFMRYGVADKANAVRLFETARALGIIHFDTADIYGANGVGEVETMLGQIRRAAPSLFEGAELATKVGIDFGVPYNSSFEYISQAAEASLRRLQTDHVDLLYIHRPDLMTHPEEVARALDSLKSRGLTKAVAVSNFTTHQVAALETYLNAPIAAHQVEFSALNAAAVEDGRLDQALSKGMRAFAWSPIAAGRIFGESDPVARRVRAALAPIEKRYNMSLTQAALSFVFSHPAGIVPIIGSTNIERLKEAADPKIPKRLERPEWYRVYEAWRGAPMP